MNYLDYAAFEIDAARRGAVSASSRAEFHRARGCRADRRGFSGSAGRRSLSSGHIRSQGPFRGADGRAHRAWLSSRRRAQVRDGSLRLSARLYGARRGPRARRRRSYGFEIEARDCPTLLERGLERRRRPAAAVAFAGRIGRPGRRNRAGWRHLACVSAQRELLARPSAACGQEARGPAQLDARCTDRRGANKRRHLWSAQIKKLVRLVQPGRV